MQCFALVAQLSLAPGYSPVLLGTLWYVWVLLGTGCNESWGGAHCSPPPPTFPCSSPSQLRETNELPFFFVSSLQSSLKWRDYGKIVIYLAKISSLSDIHLNISLSIFLALHIWYWKTSLQRLNFPIHTSTPPPGSVTTEEISSLGKVKSWYTHKGQYFLIHSIH